MVANGSAGVWEHGRERNMAGIKVWKIKKSKFQCWDQHQLTAASLCLRHHPGKAHELMKCENTCGCGNYGLSEIQLHKLMIKSMSLWWGLNSV